MCTYLLPARAATHDLKNGDVTADYAINHFGGCTSEFRELIAQLQIYTTAKWATSCRRKMVPAFGMGYAHLLANYNACDGFPYHSVHYTQY